MKVLMFGASGMVGQGVLRECLLDPDVETVLSVARSSLGRSHPKLQELVVPDLTLLEPVAGRLRGYDACFFCLGVSSAGMSESAYRAVTFDLTVRVGETLASLRAGTLTFVYVSGAGTDSTEHGRAMWARVKGATENALLRMPFRAAYMFRPALIQPRYGIRSKTRSYRVLYTVLWPFLPLLKRLAPNSVTTTDRVGQAMLQVVKHGAPARLVTTGDINRLAA